MGDLKGDVFRGIRAGDVALVRQLLITHPELRKEWVIHESWLHEAAATDHISMVKMLLELGLDVNFMRPPVDSTPLSDAINAEQFEMARYLLSRGADPTLGRTLVEASGCKSEDVGLAFVKLLVEHGADVNRRFDVFGDKNVTFSALEWAEAYGKSRIVEYLRAHGAVDVTPSKPVIDDATLHGQIIAYFKEHFGPVRPQSLIEIVPSDPPIAIHVIPASKKRHHTTLFTTGMSDQPMNVPEDFDEFRFAELFIQLPGQWNVQAINDPIELRKI